jgi:hypothetical protein
MKRKVPSPGLSYVDVNPGRLVTFQDDVLGYKSVIETRWPCLKVLWDNEAMEWIITQTDREGTESLVFATKILGEHTLERLGDADNSKSDPFADIEDWNAKMEKEQERRNAERIHEVGEKLAWAIRKDEFCGPKPRIFYAGDNQDARVGW